MTDLLILSLLLLATAFLLNVDFIYYVVYVCLGVLITSQLLAPRVLRKVQLGRYFNQNAFLGERVNIQLKIVNNSRLPIPWLQIDESVPPALMVGKAAKRTMTFRSRETKSMSYQVKAMKRGYYRLGPLLVSAGDYFGLREVSTRLSENYLTVFPRIVSLSQLDLPSRLPYGTVQSRQRLFEDPARPIGIRDYHTNDSIRHINWKVSAHAGELLVRTFEPAISLDTYIVLNLDISEYSPGNRYDGPEWAIVVAASLASHLSENRQAVGLASNGIDPLDLDGEDRQNQFEEESGRLQLPQNYGEGAGLGRLISKQDSGPYPSIPPKTGRVHLMKLLERLARIEPRREVSLSQWITRSCNQQSWGTNIIAITPSGDEKICSVLHQLVKAGYNPLLIAVDPQTDMRATRERARRLGFQAYQAREERDLNRWRKSSEIA